MQVRGASLQGAASGQSSGAGTDWSLAWGRAGACKDWTRRAQPRTLGAEGRGRPCGQGRSDQPMEDSIPPKKFQLPPRLVGREAVDPC